LGVNDEEEHVISTCSIVGCDLEARAGGVAVQSKFLAVGSAAPAAEAEQPAAMLVVGGERGRNGGATDRLVVLRLDSHRTPVTELRRLYALHLLLFGTAPAAAWLAVDPGLRDEIRERLAALGYDRPELDVAFGAWVGTANLEERVDGLERVDPVVLEALRSEQ
jgi:uncharacterized Ntn-hydrolase superfamily protein